LLERTFIHIPGIAETSERALWEQGCPDWQTFLAGGDRYSIGTASKRGARTTILRSAKALADGEHQYFARKLKQKHAWRAFPAFRHSCAYLDIETDGGNTGKSITTIGIWDGSKYHALVKGVDLENFRDLISHFSMIVTYHGLGFDLPVLQRRFPDVAWDQIHVDLCPLLRRLGVTGGLKKIEKRFGIQRPPHIDGLNGYDAVLLWRKYQFRRDESALQTLLDYNEADVVNLEVLAEKAYELASQDLLGEREPDSAANP
jgi:uncharacterized protein YprB with RNaseH-like and TPR domain